MIEESAHDFYWNRASTTCQSMPDRLLQCHSSALVQPLAVNAARRFLWTALTLKVRQLFTEAPSHSFIHSSVPLLLPFPCITYLFCDDLILPVCSLFLSIPPSTPSCIPPFPPSSLSLMKSECRLGINSHCRPSIVISLHRTAGETVLTNFPSILP